MRKPVLILCLALTAAAPILNPPPTPSDWAALARLPDLSGVWIPDMADQGYQATHNPPPWTPKIAAQIAAQVHDEHAGHPRGLFIDCLPLGMPSLMLITHNPIEFITSPGRITILGDSDGNRLRRILMDNRPHRDDPDDSFSGDSTGRWQGNTLLVDTVAILPQALIAISESIGIPNNGGMHIEEKIHLTAPNILHDDLLITAPRVLTKPWATTRIFKRHRERDMEITEGECLQGNFRPATDKDGNAIFVPRPMEDGNAVAK